LVGQQNLSEDRAALEKKLGLIQVKHLCADDITGHEIRGELDAAKVGGNQPRQRLGEQRLGCAGHAFQQHMAARQESQYYLEKDLVLAYDNLGCCGAQTFLEFSHHISSLWTASGVYHRQQWVDWLGLCPASSRA